MKNCQDCKKRVVRKEESKKFFEFLIEVLVYSFLLLYGFSAIIFFGHLWLGDGIVYSDKDIILLCLGSVITTLMFSFGYYEVFRKGIRCEK